MRLARSNRVFQILLLAVTPAADIEDEDQRIFSSRTIGLRYEGTAAFGEPDALWLG